MTLFYSLVVFIWNGFFRNKTTVNLEGEYFGFFFIDGWILFCMIFCQPSHVHNVSNSTIYLFQRRWYILFNQFTIFELVSPLNVLQQWIDLARSTGLQARKTESSASLQTPDSPNPAAIVCNKTDETSVDEIQNK